MKITACWIVKNEETNLAPSIESVRDAIDELVVVDTGSADGTVGVAESSGARVAHFEWTGDFSAARNHALSLASGDVIIFLDADEWFAPRLGHGERRIIEDIFSKNPKIEMLSIKMNNIDRQAGTVLSTTEMCRIFRNKDTLRYRGKIHEYIAAPPEGILATDIFTINHSGYSSDLIADKMKRNTAMLKARLVETAEGSDDRIRFLTYLIRENYASKEYDKASECLAEVLKYPDTLERVCRQHSEDYVSNIYAAILTASLNRAGVSRRDVRRKLFDLFKKVYPSYPGTVEIDLLYQVFFDMKEDRFLREFEQALSAIARMQPRLVSYYKNQERFLYEGAALAAWRRGDRAKSMEYAMSALKGSREYRQAPLAVLITALKGQPPEDVILLLNGIFNISNPDDLDFLIQGTRVDGFLVVYSYYLKKRMDSGDAYIGDLLNFLLIYQKYDALASGADEAHEAGDMDAALYMFMAAVCGAPRGIIEAGAGMLEEYSHILDAYYNRKRLAAVSQSDSRVLMETYNTVAFVMGIEAADSYLDVFRADPRLCFWVKAMYCEMSGLPEQLLCEDMDGIDRLDSCRQYRVRALIATGRHDEALQDIEAFLDCGMVELDVIHMLLVVAEQASGEAGAKARRLYRQYEVMYDSLIDLGDVVNTGIVFDDGGKKQSQFFKNMTRAQFEKYISEEAGRPVTEELLRLYREAADVYRQKGLPAEGARCLWRLIAHGRAEKGICENLAEIFTELKNPTLAGYVRTLVTSDNTLENINQAIKSKLRGANGVPFKKFVTYSQEFEDWILYCALLDVQKGFYVDVGASDPCHISVTKAFYDMGWNGINIEPSKDEYNKLCLDRPRDINLNIGVGAENTFLEFFLAGTGTTCDPEVARRLGNLDDIKKEIIPVRRLSDVFEEYLKKDNIIHFCKIDVEGFERSVLEGMDFHTFRPWIVVVEATLPGTHIPCHEEWEDLLLSNEYELGFSHGINRYYLDKLMHNNRIKQIKSGFDDVWNMTNKYKIERA